jgi:hypothetical protein
MRNAQSEDKPELTKGRVIPVTGMSPIFMPMFTKAWKKMMPVMPTASA